MYEGGEDDEAEARLAARSLVMRLQKRAADAEDRAAKAFDENESLVRIILELQQQVGPEAVAVLEENKALKQRLAEEQRKVVRVAQGGAQKLAAAAEVLEEQQRDRDRWKAAAEEAFDEIAHRQRSIDRLTAMLAEQQRQGPRKQPSRESRGGPP